MIDSVQTLYSSELGSAPGSVAQVREAAARLLRVAKESGVATILVGHVTKDGAVAGPRVLEHLVDCVLQFEGDRYHEHRVLRAAKNRFGSTNELGVFEMTGAGLVGVPEPSELFGRTVEGEIGAAVALRARGVAADAARDPGARRADRPRDAAARRHRRRPEAARDDRRRPLAPRADRARARRTSSSTSRAASASTSRAPTSRSRSRSPRAAKGAPVKTGTAAFGEVGLTGRLRPATQAERRLEECAKLGLAAAVAPAGTPARGKLRMLGGRDAEAGGGGGDRCRASRRRIGGDAAAPAALGFVRARRRRTIRASTRSMLAAVGADRAGHRAAPGDRRHHPLARGRADRDRRPEGALVPLLRRHPARPAVHAAAALRAGEDGRRDHRQRGGRRSSRTRTSS